MAAGIIGTAKNTSQTIQPLLSKFLRRNARCFLTLSTLHSNNMYSGVRGSFWAQNGAWCWLLRMTEEMISRSSIFRCITNSRHDQSWYEYILRLFCATVRNVKLKLKQPQATTHSSSFLIEKNLGFSPSKNVRSPVQIVVRNKRVSLDHRSHFSATKGLQS